MWMKIPGKFKTAVFVWLVASVMSPACFQTSDVHAAAQGTMMTAAGLSPDAAVLIQTVDDLSDDMDYADQMAPIVTFSMDTSDAEHGKYYHTSKVLTITVMEHHFDPAYVPTVYTDNARGYFFSGWHVDNNRAVGTVTFMEDGMYTVHFECFDRAGNKSNTAVMPQICIDKTMPELSVDFDHNDGCEGGYYHTSRTAVMTIIEKNFSAEDVQVAVTKNGKTVPAEVSQWSTSGERHRAAIEFREDARYTLTVTCKDLSGNDAVIYNSDSFVIDTIKPEVHIKGVDHQSSVNHPLSPCIEITDVNVDADASQILLEGGRQGLISPDDLVVKEKNTQGMAISFINFPQMADDIYTLTVKAKDCADNESEQTVVFRLNTAGSSYRAAAPARTLSARYYLTASSDIVIEEVNVDAIVFRELVCARDGQMTVLEENKDYTVTHQIRKDQWHQYRYCVKADCFQQEGCYSLHVYSRDAAGNETTNISDNTYFRFAIDHTSPLITVSNLTSGTHYMETVHEFSVSVKDNIKLASLSWYLDGRRMETFDERTLAGLDYTVRITLKHSDAYQNISFHAVDSAGNSLNSDTYSVLVNENRKNYFYIKYIAGGLCVLL